MTDPATSGAPPAAAHCHLYDDMLGMLREIGFRVEDKADVYGEAYWLARGGQRSDRGLCGWLVPASEDCTQWEICIDNWSSYDKAGSCAMRITQEQAAPYTRAELVQRLRLACDALATPEGARDSNRLHTAPYTLAAQASGSGA